MKSGGREQARWSPQQPFQKVLKPARKGTMRSLVANGHGTASCSWRFFYAKKLWPNLQTGKEVKSMSKHSEKDSSGPTRVMPESMQRMLKETGATRVPRKGVQIVVYPNPKGRPQKPKSPEKDSTRDEA